MILLILVSLTCVSAADETQAVDIVTQDSEIIANESITNDEYDEDKDVLADPMGPTSFSELASEIRISSDGYYELDRDFEFDAGKDSSFVNGIAINLDNLMIDGKGHSINADCKAKIFYLEGQNVTLKNINFVNGNSTDGGAIIDFSRDGNIINCTFTNCFLNGDGSMIKSGEGLTVKSSNFTDNNVSGSGIISSSISNTLTVEKCLFEDNVGRAIYAQGPLTVVDSTFNRNNGYDGGAVYLGNKGTIKGSIFYSNNAENGGAIRLDNDIVEIDNCVFNRNTAGKGGAIMMNYHVTLNVNNTSFSDNEARDGTNNIASGGGKVNLNNVTPEDLSPFAGVNFDNLEYNQNLVYGEDLIIEFTIYCSEPEISVFGGNLSIVINGKTYNNTVNSNQVKLNISDDFPVGDYSANLTYFHKELQLKNVQLITFHVSTGDDDPNLDIIIKDVGQNKPATVQITTNNTFSGNVEVIIDNDSNYTVAVTDGEGSLEISGLSRGNHTAKAVFKAWNSFRYSEKTISFKILKDDPELIISFNDLIHPGETSRLRIALNNHVNDGTVYVYFNETLIRTIDSIYYDGVETVTIYTDDFPVGEYPIRVVFSGNDDFEASEKTDTLRIVRVENRFSDLDEILRNSGSEVVLNLDYIFDPEYDSELADGINMIYHDLVIDGQGHTIDAKGLARFFTFHDPIVLKNIVFANGISKNSVDGVINSWEDATLENCTFINNSADTYGIVYFHKGATVKNSSFTDGYAAHNAGAIYLGQGGLVENCNFTNNSAFKDIMYNGRGGAIYSDSGILTVTGSRFTNNHAGIGGAIATKGDIIVNNTIFADNMATDMADNIALLNDATISVSDVDPEDLGVLKDVKIVLAEDVQNITAGEVLNITVSVKNWGTLLNVGSAYITINGKKFSAEVTNGNATIRIANLRSGNYSGNISYELENVNNSIQTLNVKFTVSGNSTEPVDPKLNITVENVYEDVNPVATITADADFSGAVTVEINSTGAAYLVMVQNGNGTVKILGLTPGIHTATVTFGGDVIYDAGSASTTFEVMPLVNSTVLLNDIEFDYGKTGSTEFSLTGATAVNATVVNHTEAVITVEGNVIKVSNLSAGSYTLNVTTIPDEGYRAVSETASITVNKVDANFSLSNVTIIYGNHVVIAGIFGDGATGFNTNYYRLVLNGEEVGEVGVSPTGNYITLYIGDAELLYPGNYTFTISCWLTATTIL